MYQLRIYSIKNKEAGELYLNKHWKKHLDSLPKYGIQVEGVFGEVNAEGIYRVIALVKYEDGADIEQCNAAYMQSPEFRADMEGYNKEDFVSVENITMDCPDYFPFHA